MPQIDLDSDRPSVLERLLAIRAKDAAAAAEREAAERLAAGLEAEDSSSAAAAGAAAHSDAASARATPSPVVVRVPLPPLARHSLVHAVPAHAHAHAQGKEHLVRRVKPPALGERDLNNLARRVGAAAPLAGRRNVSGKVSAVHGGAK